MMMMMTMLKSLLWILLIGVVTPIQQQGQPNDVDLYMDENVHRGLQSSNPRVSAEAFECDDNFIPIIDSTLRRKGHKVRVCFQPTISTRARDIRMRSIDEFTFYKEYGAAVQKVVVDRSEDNEFLTLSFCIPGNLICSFQTELSDEFFYGEEGSTGNVTGTGVVSLEFLEGAGRRTRRTTMQTTVQLAQPSSSSSLRIDNERNKDDGRNLQTTGSVLPAAGGFAGTSNVDIFFQVREVDAPKGYDDGSREERKRWWQRAPLWLKIFIIVICILLCFMCCCCLAMCMYIVRKRNEEDAKPDDGDDVINIHIHPPENGNGNGNANHDQSSHYSGHNSFKDEPSTAPSYNDDQSQSQYTGYMDPNLPPYPTDRDVCFDSDDHPGTKVMHTAMRVTLKEYGDYPYGPEIYKHVKRQLPGRRFYEYDEDYEENGGWRQLPKRELIQMMRRDYEDIQTRSAK